MRKESKAMSISKGKRKASNDATPEQAQTRPEKRVVEQASQLDVDDTERCLRERTKELDCLYGLSRLEEFHDTDMEAILHGLVDIIPSSWQYSEFTAARIIFNGETYQTANFKETRWRQSAEIYRGDAPGGVLEVCYLEETGPEYEGPFLKEERALIDALAERLRRISERHKYRQQLHRALRQLQLERDALAETNDALRVVMSRFEEEQRATSQELANNIERVAMPILQTLYTEIPHNLMGHLDLLKKALQEVSSPYVSRLTKQHSSLSPTEIVICNLIRRGLTSKEIADLRHISPVTVARHREHIRKKLGISNTNTNLTTYLQRIEADES